jgi:hypothetical protein
MLFGPRRQTPLSRFSDDLGPLLDDSVMERRGIECNTVQSQSRDSRTETTELLATRQVNMTRMPHIFASMTMSPSWGKRFCRCRALLQITRSVVGYWHQSFGAEPLEWGWGRRNFKSDCHVVFLQLHNLTLRSNAGVSAR